MEEKYISAIEKIVRLCEQDSEFDRELRKRLGGAASFSSTSLDEEPANRSMERNVRKLAENFYSDFPMPS